MRSRKSVLAFGLALATASFMLAPPVQAAGSGYLVFNTTGPSAKIMRVDLATGNVKVLLSNFHANLTPAVNPVDGRIAFSSNISGNKEIWVMDGNGANLHRLTSDSAWDTNPAWSPDGRKIAYESNRSGDFEIYRMTVATGDTARVVTLPASHEGKPTWQPGGNLLAFESDRSGAYDVWTYNLTTHVLKQFTTGLGAFRSPTFSPDGKRIAFQGDPLGNWEIYWKALGSTALHRVAASAADDEHPSFSPDGSAVSFFSERGTGHDNLYYVTLATGRVRVVTAQSDTDYRNAVWAAV
ncbi:MAG: TolB family protein [Actinobacteria bacterium]|nr:TolB family protein [Actinomycetota bacterium]